MSSAKKTGSDQVETRGSGVWARGHLHVEGLTVKPSGGLRGSVAGKERNTKSPAFRASRNEGRPTKKSEKDQPEGKEKNQQYVVFFLEAQQRQCGGVGGFPALTLTSAVGRGSCVSSRKRARGGTVPVDKSRMDLHEELWTRRSPSGGNRGQGRLEAEQLGQLSGQGPRGLVTALLRSSDVPLEDRQPPKGHRGHFSGALWAQSEGWVAGQAVAGEDLGVLGWSGGSDPQRSMRMSGC